MMFKYLVGYLFEEMEEILLLLVYINCVVDEICVLIEWFCLDIWQYYLCIGFCYGMFFEYQGQFLQEKIKGVEDWEVLKIIIDKYCIVVGMVFLVVGKQELLLFKYFNWVIIDEVLQILEFMLVGLLLQFEWFILIGDYK